MTDFQSAFECLQYEPSTGEFFWRESPRPNVLRGATAGSVRNGGYRRIFLAGRSYLAHRLAWFVVHGEWPSGPLDHINGNKSDNRIGNLRPCSLSENQANRTAPVTNTSGVKGVSWAKRKGKWIAKIQFGGKQTHLGYFQTIEAASAAYTAAAHRLHGSFARVE